MTKLADIEFASVAGHSLLLDLYMPDEAVINPPVIVWIHGGAWSFGTKEDIHIQDITRHGYAVASVNFRNSPEGQYPAQIHDLKGSIRFLRANADKFNINTDRIAVWGYSSGAHLAALMGTSNGDNLFCIPSGRCKGQ